MVSATDVITYIGVPLAVLGVTPIFYTFALALYNRINIQRTLRREGLEVPIRARLMTGVVEVDLPAYQLEPLPRWDDRYWSEAKRKSEAIGGTSWKQLNWFDRETSSVIFRLQRSDKITLPEARVNFAQLIKYFQDRGAFPCLEGFHMLRDRGQQTTVGTRLMKLCAPADSPVLTIAKPSDQHGSISLSMNWSGHRPIQSDLPPSFITGLLPDPAQDDNGTLADAVDAVSQRRRFVIELTKWGVEYVGITIDSGSANGTKLHYPHLLHLTTESRLPWSPCFTCAVIAVYASKDLRYFGYHPNQQLVYTAHRYNIRIQDLLGLGLLDDFKGFKNEGLWKWMDLSTYDASANDVHSVPLQQNDPSEESQKILANSQDLDSTKDRLREIKSKPVLKSFLFQEHKITLGKYVTMPNLSQLCLTFLWRHPIKVDSLTIGAESVEESCHYNIEMIAKGILKAMILSPAIAEGVMLEVKECFQGDRAKELKEADDAFNLQRTKVLWDRPSLEITQNFCCAIILLEAIRLKTRMLLAMEDISHCLDEWRDVYLC